MPCIFCGNAKLSREHIYSRAWIAELIPQAESFTNWLSRGDEKDRVAEWTSSEADVVVRCVCEDCNNGWMNDLDNAAKPIVNALCQGEVRVVVKDAALQTFAAWAVKMAFLMDCLLTPSALRPEDRAQFYEERTPPSGFKVWVATMEGYVEETRTTPMTLVPGREFGTTEQGFLANFRMLHLVVQVLGPMHPGVLPEHDELGARVVQQAWPREVPLEWPLFPKDRWLRDEDDYIALTRSFRTATIARGDEGPGREPDA